MSSPHYCSHSTSVWLVCVSQISGCFKNLPLFVGDSDVTRRGERRKQEAEVTLALGTPKGTRRKMLVRRLGTWKQEGKYGKGRRRWVRCWEGVLSGMRRRSKGGWGHERGRVLVSTFQQSRRQSRVPCACFCLFFKSRSGRLLMVFSKALQKRRPPSIRQPQSRQQPRRRRNI